MMSQKNKRSRGHSRHQAGRESVPVFLPIKAPRITRRMKRRWSQGGFVRFDWLLVLLSLILTAELIAMASLMLGVLI